MTVDVGAVYNYIAFGAQGMRVVGERSSDEGRGNVDGAWPI